MERKVAVVGLGYVGLPLAVAFGRKGPVIGFDVSAERVEELRNGRDRTGETSAAELAAAEVEFTHDPAALRGADFIIVAVPTPIDSANQPDLSILKRATETIGANLQRGSIVVFESTVYPGVTEEVCVPILEERSGMKCGTDFKVGYSPERINPGDREHSLAKITKVVSARDAEALETVAAVYGTVVEASIFRAAGGSREGDREHAARPQHCADERTRGDLPPAGPGHDERARGGEHEVEFSSFPAGPGGGALHRRGSLLPHAQSEGRGVPPQIILAGRLLNDGMGKYVAEQTVKLLIHQEVNVRQAHVVVLGLSFKEDVCDIRNSKVVDIVRELADYGLQTRVHDPLVAPEDAEREYGIQLTPEDSLGGADAVIVAVPHGCFREKGADWVRALLRRADRGVVVDVKSVFTAAEFPKAAYWRL